jgi:UDPglucose 6-dehydrogenase
LIRTFFFPLARLGAVAGALAGRLVVDCRNLLDPNVLRRAGISWVGVGRR